MIMSMMISRGLFIDYPHPEQQGGFTKKEGGKVTFSHGGPHNCRASTQPPIGGRGKGRPGALVVTTISNDDDDDNHDNIGEPYHPFGHIVIRLYIISGEKTRHKAGGPRSTSVGTTFRPQTFDALIQSEGIYHRERLFSYITGQLEVAATHRSPQSPSLSLYSS